MVHNTTEEEQGFKALLKLVAADITSKKMLAHGLLVVSAMQCNPRIRILRTCVPLISISDCASSINRLRIILSFNFHLRNWHKNTDILFKNLSTLPQ